MNDLDIFNLEYNGTELPSCAIVVDAATAGNPGMSKYRGILYPEGKLLFEKNIGYATNNVTEYIALVHGLAYAKSQRMNLPVYSDSKVALSWIKNGVTTSLKPTPKSKVAIELLSRAIEYRKNNVFIENKDFYLWETSVWGENPADFGNKK